MDAAAVQPNDSVVLTPQDVDDLTNDYREWSRLRSLAEKGGLFEALEALELLEVFDYYEAVSGTFYPLDYTRVTDEDGLKANPAAVLVEADADAVDGPSPPTAFQAGDDASLRGIYLEYDFYSSDEQRSEKAAFYEDAGELVVWLGWPEGKRPARGMTFREYERRHTIPKLNIANADRGRFVGCSNQGPITNDDPTAARPTFDDGNGPPPAKIPRLLSKLRKRFYDWPRVVDGQLFIPDGRGGIDYLKDSSALFGWYANYGSVYWDGRRGFVTQKQFFAELNRQAKHYDSIEFFPHEPRREGSFYTCRQPRGGDGATLKTLLDRFAPATTTDRELIKAMLLTAIWGGPSGSRPAFLITAEAGRGVGKSELAHMVARLVGGQIELSQEEEGAAIKSRLLSTEAVGKRVALLDNIKSHRFSWAELESLITCDIISGKRLYQGEGRRPNMLLWILTLNGASLSKDMAQRVVEIQLEPPRRSGDWAEKTRDFIEAKRWELFADLIGLLRGPRQPPKKHSRWATWESQVLAVVQDPDACQELYLERQGAADIEREESEIIEEFFATMLDDLTYDSERHQVFIPSVIATEWMNAATAERHSVSKVSRMLGQLIKEGSLTRLTRDLGRNGARGFIWVGEHADLESTVHRDIEARINFPSSR